MRGERLQPRSRTDGVIHESLWDHERWLAIYWNTTLGQVMELAK